MILNEGIGTNLFAYCDNNPVNLVDPTGEAGYHWIIGAGIVAFFAVATVASCGSVAAAAIAVGMVSSGMAASTVASTVYAAAFIGSSMAYGGAAMYAAMNSESIGEFNAQGSWGTVTATAGSAMLWAFSGYAASKAQAPSVSNNQNNVSRGLHTSGVGSPNNNINPGGSYTKLDNNGRLYSYTQFDELGRQTMRIDFQGRPHAGTLPHIHLFKYPEKGGRAEYVFDLNWHLIG